MVMVTPTSPGAYLISIYRYGLLILGPGRLLLLSKIRPLPYLSPPLGLSERGGAPGRQEAARDSGARLAGLSQAAGYNLSEGSASRSMR